MSFKTSNVDQIALMTAITKELTRQRSTSDVDTALYNKIIEASRLIADECQRERTYATPEMTPQQWLESDDVGMSSRYMITVLANLGFPMPDGDIPLDADDLGRCIRMVEACNLKSEIPRLFEMGDSWKRIAENWDKLNDLYKKDNYEEIYNFLSITI